MKERVENELKQELDEVIKLMTEYSNEFGITLFMPHAHDGALKNTLKHAQRLQLNTRTRKIVKITQDMMKILNYCLENPIEEEVLNYLFEKEMLIVMWSGDPRKLIEDELTTFVKDVTKNSSAEEPDELVSLKNSEESAEFLEGVLEPLVIYLDEDDREKSFQEDSLESSKMDLEFPVRSSQNTPRSSNRRSTINMRRQTEMSEIVFEADNRAKLIIPPVWTPLNQAGNFMFMFTFFREVSQSHLQPSQFLFTKLIYFDSNLNTSCRLLKFQNHRTFA